jgi:hypothetical protein
MVDLSMSVNCSLFIGGLVMKLMHLCAVFYRLKEDEPMKQGVAVVESPGLSSITTLLDSDGLPVVAPDGGSVAVWSYYLQPHLGAISIPVDERE